jgi:hypothetical protein
VHPLIGCSSIKQSVPTVVVMFGQRGSRRSRLTRVAAPTLVVLLGAACASTDLAPSTVGDQTFTAQLADNRTARDLVDQLPLTLRFRDFNRVEKIAKLPRPLTMDGVPAGDDPEINDIGYYAPSGDLVLYYGDVGYFNGIVRIGRLDAEDMSVIERQPDGFEVTIDRG